MRNAKKLMVAMLVLVAVAALAACGSDEGTYSERQETVSGKFEPTADAPAAYVGVAGEADLTRAENGTMFEISLSGLRPETRYIAHLHTGGCDQADPGGPHFQFEKGGSEEPPNEMHLQFTSGATGNGGGVASSTREIPLGQAGSIVVHLNGSHHMTSDAAGEPEAETVFIHEGVDHSKEGDGHAEDEVGHGGEPPPSEKIACAELEGAAAEEGQTASGDVPTIVVRDGEPVGGIEELEYSAGEEIRFRVSSDAAEEIHVHGYDLMKDVPAGGTVEFDFPAELEGIYEAELEGLGVQIIELRINP
jgi:hypothetical protein